MLDARPELDAQTSIAIACVRALESERPRTWRSIPMRDGTLYGWHVGRIPWRAIRDWAAAHGFDADALDLLAEVIRYVDDEREERQAADLALKTGG